MRLIVFGATGGTGRALVEQASAAGHEVTAFVRGDFSGPAKVVKGSVLDEAQVASALAGQDAVFSGLGTRPWKHQDISSQGARAIAAAMKQTGLKRLVVLSSQGVGDSTVAWYARPATAVILGRAFRDKAVMEEELAQTDLDWTVVRPGMLTNGPARGAWRVDVENKLRGGKISRADVAAFCLQELVDPKWVRQKPVVVY